MSFLDPALVSEVRGAIGSSACQTGVQGEIARGEVVPWSIPFYPDVHCFCFVETVVRWATQHFPYRVLFWWDRTTSDSAHTERNGGVADKVASESGYLEQGWREGRATWSNVVFLKV